MTLPGLSDAASAGRRDAVSALTGYVVLLTCIPSQLIFAPLGAAGTPAQMLGLVLLLWWCAHWVSSDRTPHGRTPPVLAALALFAVACVAGYLAAALRPIDAVELRGADRGLLALCAWLGIVLTTCDGIPSMDRLVVLLRRLVDAVGAIAVLGVVQFVTGRAWVDRLSLPGLSLNTDLGGIMDRSGFARPAGTAIHPLEFGVVLTMLLPVALHLAFHDQQRSSLRRWWPSAAIALAVPLSISRSAILASAVVVLFLLPTWTRPRRRQAYGLMVLLAGTVYVAVPGLLGTLQALFLGIGQDTSARSRTDSYTIVGEFFPRSPLFGRGMGTFLPSYRILDNQYLLMAIELGAFGVVSFLTLLVSGVLTARAVRRASTQERIRDLAQSLAAGLAAGTVTLATFDGLSFPMAAGLLFLLLGLTGALYRLSTAPAQDDGHAGATEVAVAGAGKGPLPSR